MDTLKFRKMIAELNEAASTEFNKAIARLQTNGKDFTWVAETLIKTAFEKDVYSRMLLSLREHTAEEVIVEFTKQLNRVDLRKSSNQFDMVESVIQQETKATILNNLNWII